MGQRRQDDKQHRANASYQPKRPAHEPRPHDQKRHRARSKDPEHRPMVLEAHLGSWSKRSDENSHPSQEGNNTQQRPHGLNRGGS